VGGIFIIAGLSTASVLFMLAFLNAIARELRKDRVRYSRQISKNNFTLVKRKPYPPRDRAA